MPALGPQGAAQLQRAMTGATVLLARNASAEHGAELEIRFDGANRKRMRQWLGYLPVYRVQGAGDLGRRMARAFQSSFGHGATRTVAIGTDCPGLTPELMHQAFQALSTHDLVLGPATDGGYYLIGLTAPVPELFSGISWGTKEVRAQTLQVARGRGISVFELPMLDDVDRPDDLPVWHQAQRRASGLSVIIPALNEAESIGATVDSARTDSRAEVIVVDGGSGDNTVAVATEHGATVIKAPTGRARQMNAGAVAAHGKTLVFVHADTLLPRGYGQQVNRVLDTKGTVAGAFALAIADKGRGLRLVAAAANWRSRHLQLPYGDQGLFVRADLFWELGGYSDIPIMEDFELARRLARAGRIGTASAPATTSARRWQALGGLRTTLINQLVISGYHLGVPTDKLATFYRGRL